MKHGGKKAFHSQDNSCGYWDSIPVQSNTDQFNQMVAGVEWTQPNGDLTGSLSLPERIEGAWQEKIGKDDQNDHLLQSSRLWMWLARITRLSSSLGFSVTWIYERMPKYCFWISSWSLSESCLEEAISSPIDGSSSNYRSVCWIRARAISICWVHLVGCNSR